MQQPLAIAETKVQALKCLSELITAIQTNKVTVQGWEINYGVPIITHCFKVYPNGKIYEWQFVKAKQGIEIARSSFFTDDEAKEFLTSYWEKDCSTKRERV